MISGRTRVYALLGDPVRHSLSPAIHNAAFRALGLDASYVALQTSAAELGAVMRTLVAGGGGGNVTIPHKMNATAVARGAEGEALTICNTFWGREREVVGADTDSIGILAGWGKLGRPVGTWLILGTGGSALAAVIAAGRAGAGIAIRSRSAARADAFADRATALGVRRGNPTEVGLVVNCTPLGLGEHDPLPIPAAEVPPGAVGLDLVYRTRGTTPWVAALWARGVAAIDGLEVLLAQATAAFQHWFPEITAPVEVMRAALDEQLR